MPDYIDIPITTDPEELARLAFDYLASQIPGYVPAAGNVEVITVEANARIASVVRDVASRVPTSIFRWFGPLAGVYPIDASAAAAQTTWTMRDTAGYTIRAGTLVGVRAAGDVLVPFQVLTDVTVAAGASVTAAGAVTIVAVAPGGGGSGLGSIGGPVELIDPLDYVATVTLVAATAGGVDAEDDADYLDRLRGRLQILTPRPVLPADFGILARDIAGVDRTLVLDRYDPGNGLYTNDRTVTVAVTNEAGLDPGSTTRGKVQTYLDGLREVNFTVFVIAATYTPVDVTYTAVASAGENTASVQAAINARLAVYLSPAVWGLPETGDARTWTDTPTVRLNKLIQTIENVPGVAYLATITVGLNGGSQTSADHTLTGPAALPTAGTITGTVT